MSKFAKKSEADQIEEIKRQHSEMKKLLSQVVKGNYGIWSAWVEQVKKLLKEVG